MDLTDFIDSICYHDSMNVQDDTKDKVDDGSETTEETIKSFGDSGVDTSISEEHNNEDVFDEDADNPPAGTPGHPGIDEGTS